MAKRKKRWVIKAGSQMVCGGGPLLLRAWARQISELMLKRDIEIVWVTSGAISTAKEKLQFSPKKSTKIHEKQALSAIGQPIVMELYNIAFQAEKLQGAQILLTYDDLGDGHRRKHFQNTIETLLKWKIVPVLNENDAVATEEIKFGDNDSLSAKVAHHVRADKLIILTDVDGLYDQNPREVASAQLIPELRGISKSTLGQKSLNEKSQRGTGGMYSKLLAAAYATKNKIETHLVKGDHPHILLDIFDGKKVGTHVRLKKS